MSGMKLQEEINKANDKNNELKALVDEIEKNNNVAKKYTKYEDIEMLKREIELMGQLKTRGDPYTSRYKPDIDRYKKAIDGMTKFNNTYDRETRDMLKTAFKDFWNAETITQDLSVSDDSDFQVALAVPNSDGSDASDEEAVMPIPKIIKENITYKDLEKIRNLFTEYLKSKLPFNSSSPQEAMPISPSDSGSPNAVLSNVPEISENWCDSLDPTSPDYDNYRLICFWLYDATPEGDKERKKFVTDQLNQLIPEIKDKLQKPTIFKRATAKVSNFFRRGGKMRRQSKRKTKRNHKKTNKRRT